MTSAGVVWIVLGCFLCTEWIVFSGVQLLIFRCVYFSTGFRFSCLSLSLSLDSFSLGIVCVTLILKVLPPTLG